MLYRYNDPVQSALQVAADIVAGDGEPWREQVVRPVAAEAVRVVEDQLTMLNAGFNHVRVHSFDTRAMLARVTAGARNTQLYRPSSPPAGRWLCVPQLDAASRIVVQVEELRQNPEAVLARLASWVFSSGGAAEMSSEVAERVATAAVASSAMTAHVEALAALVTGAGAMPAAMDPEFASLFFAERLHLWPALSGAAPPPALLQPCVAACVLCVRV